MSTSRPLGDCERLYWTLDHAGGTHFTAAVHLDGHLEEDALRPALDAWQARHPTLQARIAVEGRDVRFVWGDAPPVPIREVACDEGAWLEQAHAELNTPVPWEPGPLVRCVLLTHPTTSRLMFSFHHAASDGRAAIHLVRELLALMARGLPEPNDAALAPLSPPPAMESLMPPAARGLRALVGFNLASQRTQLSWLRTGFPKRLPRDDAGSTPWADHTPRMLLRELDEETTAALRERTRAERTTVHGALAAAQLLACAEEIKPGADMGAMLASPIDLRLLLGERAAINTGWLCISSIDTCHRVGRSVGFWDLARDVRDAVLTRATRGEPCVSLPVASRVSLGWMGRWFTPDARGAGRLASMTGKLLPYTTTLTNIGEVPLEGAASPLPILDTHCLLVLPAPFVFGSGAMTWRGRLRWAFAHREPAISGERAGRLAERSLERLRSALA